MSVLKKLQKKYGPYSDNQKENHDPMSSDHPENKSDSNYHDITIPKFNDSQNGKQKNHMKRQNTKTKDEWDSNQHLITQSTKNKLTLSINNNQLMNESFDEFELKKKESSKNQYEIWLIISLKKNPIIDINLYNTSNISILPPNNTIIYSPQSDRENIFIYDSNIKQKVNENLLNTMDDIFISIIHDASGECNEFFKFIEYLHQNKPNEKEISNKFNTLIHTNSNKNNNKNKNNKKTPNYVQRSISNRGYNPTIYNTNNNNNNNNNNKKMSQKIGRSKGSRAKLMATAGKKASNPEAAKAAEQRYNKFKKTPQPSQITTDHRRKYSIEHSQSKPQFKSSNYPQPGKLSGNFSARKIRNRNVFLNRNRKAAGGNKIAQDRINNRNDSYYAGFGGFGMYSSGGSGSGGSILDSRYTNSRKGKQIGFKNLGNTCYINAILRSINSLKCLSNDFRRQYIFDISSVNNNNNNNNNNINIYNKNSVFRSYLELLFKDLNNTKKEILDPWIFKKIIGKMDEMFASYSQQDAHELLSFLLNALHDQIFKQIVNYFDNNNNNIKKDELEWLSPVHGNFHFEIEFEYECTRCGYKRNKIESFREMSLDLPLEKHENENEHEQKHEQKHETQDANTTEQKQQQQQPMATEQDQQQCQDVVMKTTNSSSSSNKSEKEEMSEDEKEEEETKQDTENIKPPQILTPFEKLKAELIGKDGGCPIHKDEALSFKCGANQEWMKMLCTKCNNAEVDRISNPDHISTPPKLISDTIDSYTGCARSYGNYSSGYGYGTGPRDGNGYKINNWTLNELLRAYFVKKTLEYKCEHNGCGNNKVFVTSWFKQIPRVLVFHIKRFIPNYYTNSYTKSHDKVKIEKLIDINMFCNEQLSLPPDVFEYKNDNNNNICNNGNEIYDKILNISGINVLNIVNKLEHGPDEIQTLLNKDDYKDKTDSKDDDDDIVILNDKNKNKNKNIKVETDEKCNGNNSENIPPSVASGVKSININVNENNDIEMKNKNENENENENDENYLSEKQLKEQSDEWKIFDEHWDLAWSKERCEKVLTDEMDTSDKNVIEYAKMYLQHWKGIEYHKNKTKNKNNNNCDSRKRKRSNGCDNDIEPVNKKQKVDSDGNQLKIDDMFNKQSEKQMSNKYDDDPELQMAIAASMEDNNNSNNCNNNNNNNIINGLEQINKPKNIIVNSIENSGNINKFVSVCDKDLLPNNIDLTQYNLRCIVRHLGNNYQSGHYITDVLENSDENKWKRHDDQYVSDINNNNATDDKAQKNAYIFFYVHQSAFKKTKT